MQRHQELNSWIHCRSSKLTWEFASEGAFAYAVASCGQNNVNEAPVSEIDYTLRQVATLVLQKVLLRRP